jgi:RNA polymerase sigma-70 factor (ECF subfamily)
MSDTNSFAELMGRVRAGDDQAAAELVRLYEPVVRRVVRLRLKDPRLRQVLDSMDVCQSVLGGFFVRTAAGEFDVEGPEQLVGLLAKMARNKVASAARQQYRQCRDVRRGAGGDEVAAVADSQTSPSQVVAGKELLSRCRELMSDEERQLADLRAQGLAWEEIAGRLGGAAQARRMQLARAMTRVSRQLGLDDEGP